MALRLLVIAALVAVPALQSGCADNPTSGRREFSIISTDQEIQMGEQAAPEFEREFGGVVPNARLQDYVHDIGLRLARKSDRPDMPYEFRVLRSDTPNAFALPGGKIYLTAGLVRELRTEGELAAVLAHEIGHVSYRHNVDALQRQMGAQVLIDLLGQLAGEDNRQIAQTAAGVVSGMVNLKYSRDDEYEADSIGIKYLARAGYNPYDMPDMLTQLARVTGSGSRMTEFFQSHPMTGERVDRAADLVKQQYPNARPGESRATGDFDRMKSILGGPGSAPPPGRERPRDGDRPPRDRGPEPYEGRPLK